MDIQLIPFEDLLGEIERRKSDYVIGYIDYNGGNRLIKSQWNGDFVTTVGIASVLLHDIRMDPERV